MEGEEQSAAGIGNVRNEQAMGRPHPSRVHIPQCVVINVSASPCWSGLNQPALVHLQCDPFLSDDMLVLTTLSRV